MIIIGERISTKFDDIKNAILLRKPGIIQEWARQQEASGVDYLNLHIYPTIDNHVSAMEWLVETVQEVVSLPLFIDSTCLKTIEAGLKVCNKPGVINHTTAEPTKMQLIFPMAIEYSAGIVGVTKSDLYLPLNADDRINYAHQLLDAAEKYGLPIEHLWLDPFVFPYNLAQDQPKEVLKALQQINRLNNPPPKTVLKLSNISVNWPNKSLVDRVYLAMTNASGLDVVIGDSNDKILIEVASIAETLLNR